MTTACKFITLGGKCGDVFFKTGKRKKKRESCSSHDWTKKARNLGVLSQCFQAKLNES